MNEEQFQNVRRLGAYLHQDWRDEYSTADDAIAAFKADSSDEAIRAVRVELQAIIPQIAKMPDPERFLCDILWCCYYPKADGLTVLEWLEHVREKLCS
jgi:hypothetical protein